MSDLHYKTFVTGHAQWVDDWNQSKFRHICEETDSSPWWETVIAVSILLKAFGVHF